MSWDLLVYLVAFILQAVLLGITMYQACMHAVNVAVFHSLNSTPPTPPAARTPVVSFHLLRGARRLPPLL
jgi:hypothetical protein